MEKIKNYRSLSIWTVFCLVILTFIGAQKPSSFVAVKMVWGSFLVWVVFGGYIMIKNQDKIKQYILSLKFSWQKKFIIFATILALIEEAIATLMTNLAPAFGVKIGEAYLTASANFFDVVIFHSVILFIPMFYAWTRLLNKYSFTASQVFWLFGASGTIAEFLFNQSPLGIAGLWFFVYGLMVYLPAYTLPERAGLVIPQKKHFVLAIFYPFIFVPFTAWLPLVLKHPPLHF